MLHSKWFPPVWTVAWNHSVPTCLKSYLGSVQWLKLQHSWMNVWDVILLLRAHCDRGFFITEGVACSLGQRQSTAPWWAGPSCASSSIMQGMARAVTQIPLSLLLHLPNNLCGHKPHTLSLLVTDVNFWTKVFRCIQLGVLTSSTKNHLDMRFWNALTQSVFLYTLFSGIN